MPNQKRKIVRRDYSQISRRPPAQLPAEAPLPKFKPESITVQPANPSARQKLVLSEPSQPKPPAKPIPSNQPGLVNMKLYAGLCGLALLALAVFWAWPNHHPPTTSTGNPAQPNPGSVTTQPSAAAEVSSANFQYDAVKQTASYNDNLGGKELFVEEQRQASVVNAALLSKIAQGNGGGSEISTGKGKAFIIQSSGVGQQVVVFGSGQILVVINSQGVINQADWTNYINNFRTKSPA